jgi:hypothetical protein
MAARYWVGGTGAWDSTNTANWSATSGGAGGASVPGAADTPQFDANSGTGTVTFTNSAVTTTTITHNAPNITLSLGAAISSSSSFTVSAGAFITNGYSVTATTLASNVSTTRSIALGSSLVTLTATGNPLNFNTTTGLTFDAGTSSIVFPSISGPLTQNLSGLTYYNVSYASTNSTSLTINGANTFHDLSFVGTNATTGILSVALGANQTITGTLSNSGTSPIKRVFFSPTSARRQLTAILTCNAVSSIDNCDFYEVIFAGNCISGGNLTGTSVGDGGGNSGITFSTPKTVYWVGASGAAWYSANWATSSGGTGAAANMPLPQDTMIIDDFAPASGGTVGPGSSARAVAGAIDFSARTLPVTFDSTLSSARGFWFGSMTLNASMTLNLGSAAIYFAGATVKTLISAGQAFNRINIESLASGGLNIGDALITDFISMFGGSLNTNGYSLTVDTCSGSNDTTSKTLNFGASTVTFSSGGLDLQTGTVNNTVINGGTSNLVFTGSLATIRCTSGSVYNVTCTSAPTSLIFGGVTSANNITFPATATAGAFSSSISFGNNFTINGTLTIGASASILNRTFIRSNFFNTVRAISINAVSSGLANLDFLNITVTGAVAPISGTNFGDCGGNSGITFPAAKTVYWNLAAGGNFNATAWATSVGGTPNVNNFPLAQDTAVFAATGLNSGATVTYNAIYYTGSIDMSLRTSNTMTFSFSVNAYLAGNWTNGTGTTISSTRTLFFIKNGTQTITSAGKTFTTELSIDKSGSLILQDAFLSSNGVRISAGTIDLNSYSLTCTSFNTGAQYPNTIAMNSGTIVCTTSSGAFNGGAAFTTFTGSGIISLTSASAKIFTGAGIQSFPTLNQGGTGALTISGSNKFADMTNTAIGAVRFTGGTSNEFTDFNLNGVSGNLLTLGSTNTTQAILKKSTPWNVGANSVDAGNNTGLNFI